MACLMRLGLVRSGLSGTGARWAGRDLRLTKALLFLGRFLATRALLRVSVVSTAVVGRWRDDSPSGQRRQGRKLACFARRRRSPCHERASAAGGNDGVLDI